jgi:hypothetical protein
MSIALNPTTWWHCQYGLQQLKLNNFCCAESSCCVAHIPPLQAVLCPRGAHRPAAHPPSLNQPSASNRHLARVNNNVINFI